MFLRTETNLKMKMYNTIVTIKPDKAIIKGKRNPKFSTTRPTLNDAIKTPKF